MVSRSQKQTAWLVILSVLAIHLVLAPGVPLGVDEAHYALYALHPALSYFDHPPLVGWLQMLVAPLSYSEFTVRLLPGLLYALASVLVYRLSFRLFPDGPNRQGLIAVFLLNTAPILQLMGWGLVPDLPLMVIALLATELVYRIHENNRFSDWLLLGVAYGFAGLSKYTAVFLPFAMVIFMTQHHGLRWLRQPGPWVAALISLLFISPVLIWNAANDWISFSYQTDRGLNVDGWKLKGALSIQVAQMLLYSILAFVGAIAATVAVVRNRDGVSATPAAWLLIWSAWPLLVVTGYSAGGGAVLPNWPAMAWTLIAPLTARWICLSWSKLWVKGVAIFSSVLSVGLIVFVFGFLAFMPLSTFPFMKPVIKDLVGWQQAAVHGRQLLEEMRAESGTSAPVLLVDNWTRASRIAWYAQPVPVQVLSSRTSQFSVWFGHPDQNTRGILIRDRKEAPEDGRYSKDGLDCALQDVMNTGVDGVTVNKFQFYRCEPSGS